MSQKYFAARDSNETIEVLQNKCEVWFRNIQTTGYMGLLSDSWYAYHGNFYNSNSHQITFGGDQGELTQLAVNHYRNIARNILNTITAHRPKMQARAINTDQKSIRQTVLANDLLDYYMREHRLETNIRDATEQAIVMASGHILIEWNSNKGEIYDFNEELGIEIREGDLEFTNVDTFNLVFDTSRKDRKKDWVIVRDWVNRYDIAETYPELKDQILSVPTKSQIENHMGFSFNFMDDTDDIPVYKFYHKRTPALPEGRYMMYLDKDITLIDTPMPYRDLPVYTIAPSYYLGTAYAYSDMFDLLGIQDAINSIYTTMLTNISTFGVQHVVTSYNSNINVEQISSGLSFIQTNNTDDIKALNLTQQPQGIFDIITMLERAQETISGVNSVTRGNPDPSLRSGNALALVQSMTLQFLSGLQQSYVGLIEQIGTGIINILKDHAAVPRVATIVGRNKRSYTRSFTGDELGSVNRVVVEIGNPLASTTAGRVEMADNLLQMGVVDAYQYLTVIETGNLNAITEDITSQLDLIRGENERLVDNEQVMAIFTDNHVQHIKEHSAVINDPDLRMDAELVQRVAAHIQEHIDLLKTTDPATLEILGQPSLAQPANPPTPEAPQGPQGGSPVNEQLDPTAMMGGVNTPMPPAVDPSLLPNPQLQELQQATIEQMNVGPNG